MGYSHKAMFVPCPSISALCPSPPYVTRLPCPLASNWAQSWPKFRGMGKSEVKVFILLFPSLWGPFELAVCDNHCSLFYPRRLALYNSFSFKVSTASLSSHHLVSRSGDSAMWSASSSLWFPFATHTTVINPHVNKCSLNHPFVFCWDSDKNQDTQRVACLVER